MSYKYLFKLVMLGNSHVGKSSIVNRLCNDNFSHIFNSTIGVDFSATYLQADPETIIKLQIWDTAGQHKFAPILRNYYNGVAGIVMVYDVSSRKSFNKLYFWLDELNNNTNVSHHIPIIIVGHKNDKVIRRVTRKEAEEFAHGNNMHYIEASAKSGENIQNIFIKLSEQILINIENGCEIGIRRNPVNEIKLSTGMVSKSNKRNATCCWLC